MADNEHSIISIIESDLKETTKEYSKSLYEANVEARRKQLRETLKDEKAVNDQLEKDRQELRRANAKQLRDEDIRQTKQQIEEAATLEQKKQAEKHLRDLENQKALANQLEDLQKKAANILVSAGSKMFDDIDSSIKSYSSYFSEIQTRLLGSGKTYTSVADMISKTFNGSPFFAMADAMSQVKSFVQQGIAYNVELRAALQVVSEKVATTFNALDATLLRLVRIQGDSTQARLGIESRLTEVLNSQFQDTSYLTSNINETVSAALLEAEATLGQTAGTEFEYEAQKWLGSLYSVGASQNLVTSIAQGLGYLGSGDITSLSSNESLTNLLAMATTKGGGTSLGDIITRGATASDISAIFNGLRALVSEISDTGSVVALKEYANVFGLTVSDLKSVLNLTADDMQLLTEETLSYDEAVQRVNQQLSFSTLANRTSAAEMVDNLYSNMINSIADRMANNKALYAGWEFSKIASELTSGLTLEVSPFGVGTSIDIGQVVKAGATANAALMSLDRLVSGLGNIGSGLDLSKVKGAETVKRGSLSSLTAGEKQSYSSFTGDVSDSAIYKTSYAAGEESASKITDESIDEQKQQVEDTLSRLQSIDDNVERMVRLMDSDGIVIRGRASETTSVFASQLAGVGGIYQG